MNRLSVSQEIRIPPDAAINARAAEQDFRRVVAEYRARQRRRKLFRQIFWTMYWAVIFSAGLLYLLRMVGAL